MLSASHHNIPVFSRHLPCGSAGIPFLLALLALLASLGAAWIAWNASNQLRIAQVQWSSNSPLSADATKVSQLRAEVEALRAQVAQLSTVVEGPMGHLAASYERDIDEVRTRVAGLEKQITLPPEIKQGESVAREKSAPSGAQPTAKSEEWLIHLSSSEDMRIAEKDLAHAQAAGFAVRLTTGKKDGMLWHRVTVAKRFATVDEARAYLRSNAAKAGFSSAWIAKR